MVRPDVGADGFLKQMVRNLMGLLVEAGRGGLTPPMARAPRRQRGSPTAVPGGLA